MRFGREQANTHQTVFASGETYYDDYAQAWRILGTYIDCNPLNDGADENDNNENDNNNDNDKSYYRCRRYWLWAAYVDLDYQGKEHTEYQFLDKESGLWIENCDKNSKRCVKMDCHEADTHFTLLGIYKFAQNDENWMDQLFKHEGYCLWNNKLYNFMSKWTESWPLYCSNSYVKDSDGNIIYYDIKPEDDGSATIGLYSDSSCLQEKQADVQTVLGQIAANGGTNLVGLYRNMDKWDEGLGQFKICQPCISYNLRLMLAIYNRTSGDDVRRSLEEGDDDDDDAVDDDNEYNPYYCADDAGYENVNQCYKFGTQTDFEMASVADLQMASRQRTIVPFQLGDQLFAAPPTKSELQRGWIYFGTSLFFFTLSFLAFLGRMSRSDRDLPDALIQRMGRRLHAYEGRKRNRRNRISRRKKKDDNDGDGDGDDDYVHLT